MSSASSLFLACAILAADAAMAQQHSLLFTTTVNEIALRPGGYESLIMRPDEVVLVTPRAGVYSASVFLTTGAQWAYVGDKNSNGRLVDYDKDGPGFDTDAVFVKNLNGSNQYGPRDIYVSKESSAGLATNDEDGSVFRFASQGVLDVFVDEDTVLNAIGQAPSANIDIDAICQSGGGDVFVSFDTTEDINGTNVTDGGIVRIPASGISYNLQGNVIAMSAGVAEIVATETDVGAWITASGVQTAVRRNPGLGIDITGLELDPQGGTWTSPTTGGTLPNLMFCWDAADADGAVLSTSGGGSIASLNGIALGSQSETNGSQVGLLPDNDGINGLSGLAVVPQQAAPLALECYPVNLVTTATTLYTRQEVSNATPNGTVVFFLDNALGSTFPALSFPLLSGQLFGAGLIVTVGTTTADSNGYAWNSLRIPPSAISGSRFAVAWQALDFSALALATPAAMQFL